MANEGASDSAALPAVRQPIAPVGRAAADREPREKRSVTLDAPVARAVERLVQDGRAASFSAAINAAAARWVANQQLRAALDELYEQEPESRPSPQAVAAAARELGLG